MCEYLMLPRDYSIRDIKKGFRDPSLFLSAGLDIFEHDIYVPIRNSVFNAYHGNGTKVMEEDWDTLVILDAARYDEFKDRNFIDGKLESRLSRGGYSEEFIQKNFAGGEYHDTVYVSGNPHAAQLGESVFHDLVQVEMEPVGDPIGPTDERNYAIRPSTVLDETIRAHETYPRKRLIVHFMQPHLPFIGENGMELYQQLLTEREEKDIEEDDIQNPGTTGLSVNPYAAARHDMISVEDEDIREAYRENLDIGLTHAQLVTEEIPGKTVVTADHGELLGERYVSKKHGHPHHIRVPELYIVPWLVVDSSGRRSTTADPPVASERLDDETVEEHLSALGYT